MEDVLDLYAKAYDHKRPQVCLDERPVQLLGDSYAPIPMQVGQAQRYDYHYEREGTANLFMHMHQVKEEYSTKVLPIPPNPLSPLRREMGSRVLLEVVCL